MNDIKWVPALVTTVLHGVVMAFLLIGIPKDSQVVAVRTKPLAIQAKLVMEKSVSRPARLKPASKPISARSKPVVRPAPKLEAVKKPEIKSEPKLVSKPKAAPKPKGLTPEEISRKKAEEKVQYEAQQRALEEEIRGQQQQELADALAFADDLAFEDDLVEDGELTSTYTELITSLIAQNWSLPPTARNGMQAIVQIITVPSGEIVGHKLTKGSGNPAFDLSAIRAITRLGKIDELADLYKTDPSAYEEHFRMFNFKFVPKDLRR